MMAFVSKEEYLKRYLSGSDFEDKKKKRKRKPKQGTAQQSRMKIVDDDITVNDVAPSGKEEADLYEDEAPTVAGLVDERPEEIQQLEAFRSGAQWKKFNEKEAAKRRHDSDSDQSPVRQRHDSDSDGSPPRRQRHDSGSDQSPPRRQRNDSSSDQSPPRRQRKDSGSDQSPPQRQRRDSSSDQSPPRRKKQNSDSDQSPPRRRRQNSDSDQSPPRKSSGKRKSEDVQKGTKKRTKPSRFDAPLEPEQDDRGRAKKTLAGLTAGLSTARAMRMENDAKRKREQDMFDQASEAMLGRNSKTVFRDKETGKRRNLVKEGEAEAKENAIKEELLAKYKAWGKGLAQQEAQDKRTQEALAVADRPLARLAGDEHLEAELREQEREGDPMLAYLRKKKTKSVAKDIPRYKGPQPPANRFNLWPGYRWDGIDRSNGFEKSLFSKRSERKAVEQDAYKWSVEDM